VRRPRTEQVESSVLVLRNNYDNIYVRSRSKRGILTSLRQCQVWQGAIEFLVVFSPKRASTNSIRRTHRGKREARERQERTNRRPREGNGRVSILISISDVRRPATEDENTMSPLRPGPLEHPS
jgi:hypothetical protein